LKSVSSSMSILTLQQHKAKGGLEHGY